MIRLRRWGGLQRTKRHQRLLALPFLISKGVLKPDTHRWAVHIQPWRDRSILCPWNVPVRRESSLSVVVNEIRRKLENAMGHDVVLRASIRRRLSTRIRPRYFDFWPGGGVCRTRRPPSVQLYCQMPDLPPNSHTPRYSPRRRCSRSAALRLAYAGVWWVIWGDMSRLQRLRRL